MPASSVSAIQGAPVIPPVPLSHSQTGTLTLRISPSGLKSIASETNAESKIGGRPNCSLIPLQTGSFALLQFPGQKSASDSTVKQAGSPEVKNTSKKDEFHAVPIEEKTSHTQEDAAITVSDIKIEENTWPAKKPDSLFEGVICDRNVVTPEIIERDADIVVKLSNGSSGSQPDAVSSDYSYLDEKIKCDEIKGKVKKEQNVRHSEDTLDEVPYSSEDVSEGCNQTTFLAHNSLQKPMDTTYLKSSNEDQTQSVKKESFANSGGAEQAHLEMEEMFVDVQSSKPRERHKVYMDSKEELPKKSPFSQCEDKDLKALFRNRKPVGDSEGEKEKPKVGSAKTQTNTSGKKYMDGAEECFAKIDGDFQVNCNKSTQEIITTSFQENEQSVKKNLSQISRPSSKTSTRPVPLENHNISVDEHVDKSIKCMKQNTVKTNHCKKDYTDIIDITMDDTEKDEKTDDSADETVDEISGYRSEDVVNIETLVSIYSSLKWKGKL